MKKKKMVCAVLAALLALTLCTGAGLAYCQPDIVSAITVGSIDPLYHHGSSHHGGHHDSGHHDSGHHDEPEDCDWLFRAYGKCKDVNCTKKSHSHRCDADCANENHRHYSVCQYADGTLKLGQKKA